MRIAAVVIISAIFGGTAAQSAPLVEGPWCGVRLGRNAGVWRCQYWSLEQCRSEMIAGERGYCNMNPAYLSGPPQRHRKRVMHGD
jgi:hypothetical protein